MTGIKLDLEFDATTFLRIIHALSFALSAIGASDEDVCVMGLLTSFCLLVVTLRAWQRRFCAGKLLPNSQSVEVRIVPHGTARP